MTGKWLPLAFCAAALVFCVLDTVYYFGQLPERMASHFDAQGNPNGWSTKAQFVVMMAASITLLTSVMLSVAFGIRYFPQSLINLPNKDYWFAPERKANSREAIAEWTAWFMAATLWLLAFVFHEAMVANFRQPPQLQSVWWMLSAYGVVAVYLIVRLFGRFRRPA